MDRLTSMAVFVAAVEKGSFTAAAADVGVTASMVGQHIKGLEARVGGRLLNRTTRRQGLTEIGQAYYERCKRILADIDDAEATAGQLQAEARGRLRVAAPVTWGVHCLAPALARYMDEQPLVDVEIILDNRNSGLIDEGFEVAIRLGPLTDSTLIARRLAPYRLAVVAAPAYVERHGVPATPQDLAHHNCIKFTYWGVRDEWPFKVNGEPVMVKVDGRLSLNNADAMVSAARAGLGITMAPEIVMADDLRTGRLIKLLDPFQIHEQPVYLVYLPDRRPSAKVRSFIDFMLEHFPGE